MTTRYFDLQMFAEDEAVETAAKETVVETTEPAAEEPEAIPPELDGLDDADIAKEIMAEAKGMEEPESEPEEAPAEPKVEGAPGPIPYPRFKQEIDKSKSKDEEIAKLKEELEKLRSQSQQPIQPPMQQPMQPQAQPTPQAQPMPQASNVMLTEENINLINQAIEQEALRLSQMTKDDLDSIEYMEDTDPRKQRWQYAQEMARGTVFARIRNAQQAKAEQARQFLQAHNAAIAEFNAYAEQQTHEPDFEGVKNYAVNEYFKGLPGADKQVIAAAYARVERNVASPQDIYTVKNYFAQAQRAYRSQHPVQAKQSNKSNKMEQASSFPRSSQVAGSGDAGGGVTVASLEKMLNEMPWDKIDPKYQRMLTGE